MARARGQDAPLIPANAGIQFLAEALGPRFRGDERESYSSSLSSCSIVGRNSVTVG
jgi:hypothetical protein